MANKYDPHAADNKITFPAALPFGTPDRATSGANASAVVTISADAARPIIITQIVCSYSAAPTGGQIQVKDGTTVVFEQGITAGGPTVIDFTPPRSGTIGNSMTITLAAGGTGIVGELDVNAHYLV